MSVSWKPKIQRLFFACSAIVLATILAACGGSGTSVSPTATPQSSPSGPPVFRPYSSPFFSITYPENWVIRTSRTTITFSDTPGTYNLAVNVAPDPHGSVSSDQLAEQSLKLTRASLLNPQSVNMPSTITLAGVTWSQRAIIGDTLSNGQRVAIEVVILTTNYPEHAANTKGVVLSYLGAKALFTQAQSAYFSPMLQAFKFTSS